jgi:hypothetical protein
MIGESTCSRAAHHGTSLKFNFDQTIKYLKTLHQPIASRTTIYGLHAMHDFLVYYVPPAVPLSYPSQPLLTRLIHLGKRLIQPPKLLELRLVDELGHVQYRREDKVRVRYCHTLSAPFLFTHTTCTHPSHRESTVHRSSSASPPSPSLALPRSPIPPPSPLRHLF